LQDKENLHRERERERDGVDRVTLTALILENNGTDTVDKAY
jgi:hypothetical protein